MAVLSSELKPLRTSRAGKRHKQVATVTLAAADRRAIQARHLDLQADCLLQAGHRAAAELLAWRAAALREVSP